MKFRMYFAADKQLKSAVRYRATDLKSPITDVYVKREAFLRMPQTLTLILEEGTIPSKPGEEGGEQGG